MPVFASIVTLVVVGYISLQGEVPRRVFMDLHQTNPAGVGEHFYYTIINAFCIGFGNLMVTLRDKKLISKGREASIIVMLNMIALVSLYHITVPSMMRFSSHKLYKANFDSISLRPSSQPLTLP